MAALPPCPTPLPARTPRGQMRRAGLPCPPREAPGPWGLTCTSGSRPSASSERTQRYHRQPPGCRREKRGSEWSWGRPSGSKCVPSPEAVCQANPLRRSVFQLACREPTASRKHAGGHFESCWPQSLHSGTHGLESWTAGSGGSIAGSRTATGRFRSALLASHVFLLSAQHDSRFRATALRDRLQPFPIS